MIAHVKGSATSKAAAESMEEVAPSMQKRVLRFIASRGAEGATDDAIEGALGLRHQSASARRRELVLAGFVSDSGRTAKTRSGRAATLWVQSCWAEPQQRPLL